MRFFYAHPPESVSADFLDSLGPYDGQRGVALLGFTAWSTLFPNCYPCSLHCAVTSRGQKYLAFLEKGRGRGGREKLLFTGKEVFPVPRITSSYQVKT